MAKVRKQKQTNAPMSGSPVGTQAEPIEPISGIADSPVNGAPIPVAVKERVTVTLNSSGGLDLDSMRESTKEKLIAAIRASQDGLFPKAPDVPIKRWPEIAIRGIYGVLGAAETAIAGKKYPMEVAAAVFQYSDSEIAVLMEPTQAVLAKYGAKMERFQEETALVLALAQVHIQKVHALKQFMAQYEAQKKQEAVNATAPGPKVSDTTSPIGGDLQ